MAFYWSWLGFSAGLSPFFEGSSLYCNSDAAQGLPVAVPQQLTGSSSRYGNKETLVSWNGTGRREVVRTREPVWSRFESKLLNLTGSGEKVVADPGVFTAPPAKHHEWNITSHLSVQHHWLRFAHVKTSTHSVL